METIHKRFNRTRRRTMHYSQLIKCACAFGRSAQQRDLLRIDHTRGFHRPGTCRCAFYYGTLKIEGKVID